MWRTRHSCSFKPLQNGRRPGSFQLANFTNGDVMRGAIVSLDLQDPRQPVTLEHGSPVLQGIASPVDAKATRGSEGLGFEPRPLPERVNRRAPPQRYDRRRAIRRRQGLP